MSRSLVPVKPVSVVSHEAIQELSLAAQILKQICDELDQEVEDAQDTSADISVVLQRNFNHAALSVQENVDALISFRAMLKAKIEDLQEIYRLARKRTGELQSVLEKTDKQAIEVIEAFPDQPFVGTMQQIKTQKNPPSVKVSFETKEKAYSNIVPKEFVEMFGLDERYYKTETVYALNLKAIGDDLKAGIALPWAEAHQGKRLNTKLKG